MYRNLSVTLPVLKGLERRRAAEAALERLHWYELRIPWQSCH
jgi:hypothetical protein